MLYNVLRLTQSIAVIDWHTCASMVCPVRATERKIMGEYLSKQEIADYASKNIDALLLAVVESKTTTRVKIPVMRIKPTLIERIFAGKRTTTYTDIDGLPLPHTASPWTDGVYLVPITTSVAGEKFRKTYLHEIVVAVPETWPKRTNVFRGCSVEVFIWFDVLDDGRLTRQKALNALDRLKGALESVLVTHE